MAKPHKTVAAKRREKREKAVRQKLEAARMEGERMAIGNLQQPWHTGQGMMGHPPMPQGQQAHATQRQHSAHMNPQPFDMNQQMYGFQPPPPAPTHHPHMGMYGWVPQ